METYEEQIFPGFEVESTCSQPVSPASPQVLPGSEKAKRMTVGSGRQCSMLLAESSPLGRFSRILLGSSHWTNSEEFSYVWNRLDTKFALSAFQLTALGQNTEDNGCSLWPTPIEGNSKNGQPGESGRYRQTHPSPLAAHGLAYQAKTPKLWPTPIRKDAEEGSGRGHHLNPEADMKAGIRLKEAVVKLWPTPVVNDARNGRNATANQSDPNSTHHAGTTLSDAIWLWPTPNVPNGGRRNPSSVSITGKKPDGGKAQIDLREFAIRSHPLWSEDQYQEVSGSLNPEFVEWLMGFPPGWTQCPPLSLQEKFEIDHTALKRSETPLSPSKRSRSSRQLLT